MSTLVGMFINTWLHPVATMETIRTEGTSETPGGFSGFMANVRKYMLFVLAMGLLSGIITAIIGTIVPPATAGGNRMMVWLAVAVVPIVSFIGSFLGALIIWALVDGLLSGKGSGYTLSYKLIAVLAAFSPISALLAPIPTAGQYLAIGLNIWATVVMIIGIIVVRRTPVVRTWVVCGLLFAFLFLLGVFARVAAQRQFAGGPADFGTDLGTAGDDLDEQLEDLANPAQQPQTPAAPK